MGRPLPLLAAAALVVSACASDPEPAPPDGGTTPSAGPATGVDAATAADAVEVGEGPIGLAATRDGVWVVLSREE